MLQFCALSEISTWDKYVEAANEQCINLFMKHVALNTMVVQAKQTLLLLQSALESGRFKVFCETIACIPTMKYPPQLATTIFSQTLSPITILSEKMHTPAASALVAWDQQKQNRR
jgi:hypothetical protein